MLTNLKIGDEQQNKKEKQKSLKTTYQRLHLARHNKSQSLQEYFKATQPNKVSSLDGQWEILQSRKIPQWEVPQSQFMIKSSSPPPPIKQVRKQIKVTKDQNSSITRGYYQILKKKYPKLVKGTLPPLLQHSHSQNSPQFSKIQTSKYKNQDCLDIIQQFLKKPQQDYLYKNSSKLLKVYVKTRKGYFSSENGETVNECQ